MRDELFLRPKWPSTLGSAGLMSTRAGGVSAAPMDTMNLRWPSSIANNTDSEDDPAVVRENRRRFAQACGATPVYLRQVHGNTVANLGSADLQAGAVTHEADASITTHPGIACTVLVADCLPVLFAAPNGRGVGAAHAGWRGLAGGVLEATVAALTRAAGCDASDLHAWLGACIGPRAFEVGDDVLAAFGAAASRPGPHFVAGARRGKWLADLPALARVRLGAAGVLHLSGGHWCTVEDRSRFFSFRRDRVTGRMGASVYINR